MDSHDKAIRRLLIAQRADALRDEGCIRPAKAAAFPMTEGMPWDEPPFHDDREDNDEIEETDDDDEG